jgi:hypothetical protein
MPELMKLSVSETPIPWVQLTGDMAARAQDLTPVFEMGDQGFRLEMAEQFRTQGAYLQGGTQWEALSPEYARRKPPPPAPFGILYRSGRGYEALTTENGEHVKVIEPQQAWYGAAVLAEDGRTNYMAVHDQGRGRMPQRKIIVVRDRFRKLMVNGLLAWIVGGRRPGASE